MSIINRSKVSAQWLNYQMFITVHFVRSIQIVLITSFLVLSASWISAQEELITKHCCPIKIRS